MNRHFNDNLARSNRRFSEYLRNVRPWFTVVIYNGRPMTIQTLQLYDVSEDLDVNHQNHVIRDD